MTHDEGRGMDLAEFVLAHGERLIAAIMAVTGLHRMDAEDAAQEALLSVVERGDELATAADLFRWLRTCARNAAIDRTRDGFATRVTLAPDVPSPDRLDLGDVAEVVLLHDRLHAALVDVAALPADQRDVLLLRHVEGLWPRQIAEQLGLDVAEVKYLLRAARATLRKGRDRRELGAVLPALFAARTVRRTGRPVPLALAVGSTSLLLVTPPTLVVRPHVQAWHAPAPPRIPRDLASGDMTNVTGRPGRGAATRALPVAVPSPRAPRGPVLDARGQVCVNSACVGTGRRLPPPDTADMLYLYVPPVGGQDGRYVWVRPVENTPVCPTVPTTPVTGCAPATSATPSPP